MLILIINKTTKIHFLNEQFVICYIMTFYYNEYWLGYLAENFIRKCINKCQEECAGCRDGMKSVILHLHVQLSLLEKLKCYFEIIRGDMLKDIMSYYSKIENKLPHSTDIAKDKIIYCNIARTFLLTSSAETVYYGRYITEETDNIIADAFSVDGKKKRDKKVT